MKKLKALFFITLALSLIFLSSLNAQTDTCSTKYPIVLVHGISYRDNVPIKKYWGKIPDYLEKNGAKVFIANVDALGTIESNAVILKKIILQISETEKCQKVNIIAHSKGGLDSRYMLAKLKMADYVASLTTVSTPHHGSIWANLALYSVYCSGIEDFAEKASYFWAFILNDENPDPMKAYNELTTNEMNILNNLIPDVENVYYQSYGSYLKNEYPSFMMKYRNKTINEYDGLNDGVVPVSSFQWTNFKGFAGENNYFGVSHFDIIGFTNITFFDEKTFFRDIVADLKNSGF